jgi:hypothetical protein
VVVGCLVALAGGSCTFETGPRLRAAGTVGVIQTDLDVQSLAMSMADDYTEALFEATRPIIMDPASSATARQVAQTFQRNGTASAIDIAVGPNPDASVLDMLILVTLQRWAFSAHIVSGGIGEEAATRAAARLQQAEAEAWSAAATVLSAAQQKTMRELIDSWIAANPERFEVAFVRFDEFVDIRYAPTASNRKAASGLLKELTEASEVVDSARLLGERALWYASRYPLVLGQQVETTAYRLVDQPEVRSAFDAVESAKKLGDSISARADSLDADLKGQQEVFFANVARERAAAVEQAKEATGEIVRAAAEDFETRINAARDAAVTQAFDRLAKERKDLLDDLESRKGAIQETLTELHTTIDTTTGLAKELTGTVDAIDRVVARFDREAAPGKEALDIKDVRDAAIEATKAAEKMTILLERTNDLAGSDMWDKRLSQLDHATNSVIDRAFWRGVVLVLILVVGLGLVRLIPVRGRVGG